MAKASALERVRTICLALPDTKETLTWGKPHFRVGEKIFCGYGEQDAVTTIGFKLEMAHAEVIVERAEFWRAPYVGHKGWVSLDVAQVEDWNEVRLLILESYQLIAPKRSLAKLNEAAAYPATKKTAKKKVAAKPKSAVKKAKNSKAKGVKKKSC